MVAKKESLSDFEREVEDNQRYAATILNQTLSNIDAQEIKYRQFELDFREGLKPNLSESEILDHFVGQALKVEFGPTFVANQGFPRLKHIVSQAAGQAREVKAEILNYTSRVLKEQLGLTGKPPQ